MHPLAHALVFLAFSASTPSAIKADVRELLAAVYDEFDVDFVTTEPVEPHATIIFSDDGPESWAYTVPGTMGITEQQCDVQPFGLSVVFRCASAFQCAYVAAHEYGHQLGLEHVDDAGDLMSPTYRGPRLLQDREMRAAGACRETQNSRALVRERLGERRR